MVLIRKRYFRSHLQQKHDDERFRDKARRKLLRIVHFRSSGDPQIRVGDGQDDQAMRADPSRGIGQALAIGTMGIGLSMGAAAQTSPQQTNEANGNIPSPLGLHGNSSYVQRFFDGDHLEVQSPDAVSRDSGSMEIPTVIGNSGRAAPPNVLTSSPRSDAAPLPQSPTSIVSRTHIQYLAIPDLNPHNIRQRQGE